MGYYLRHLQYYPMIVNFLVLLTTIDICVHCLMVMIRMEVLAAVALLQATAAAAWLWSQRAKQQRRMSDDGDAMKQRVEVGIPVQHRRSIDLLGTLTSLGWLDCVCCVCVGYRR